jgi:hypothetical protein
MKVEGDNQRAEALRQRTVMSSNHDQKSRYKNESEKDTHYSLHIDLSPSSSTLISRVPRLGTGARDALRRRMGALLLRLYTSS